MDDIQLTIERWILKAEHDLQTAQTMLGQPNPPTDVVCFHSQQCAEKMIKSFLVKANLDFPPIHDLHRLLQLCIQHDPSFRSLNEATIILSDYAVEVRYPDDWREIEIEEAREALRQALRIKEFILSKLKD
jgi:HEPN domain-containing protein